MVKIIALLNGLKRRYGATCVKLETTDGSIHPMTRMTLIVCLPNQPDYTLEIDALDLSNPDALLERIDRALRQNA